MCLKIIDVVINLYEAHSNFHSRNLDKQHGSVPRRHACNLPSFFRLQLADQRSRGELGSGNEQPAAK